MKRFILTRVRVLLTRPCTCLPQTWAAHSPSAVAWPRDPQNGQTAPPRAAGGEFGGAVPVGIGVSALHSGHPTLSPALLPGGGTHRHLPLAHLALRGGRATSCHLRAHPAAPRTIASPAPACSAGMSPLGPCLASITPCWGQGCPPCLAFHAQTPPHPGSACGAGAGGAAGDGPVPAPTLPSALSDTWGHLLLPLLFPP